ncbi:MAG: sigma-70 family RNA polymerase sigma factor, partial [Bdellovibrionales bacterium]|nr:sigma-70 family RNA polymerase sigma factor [Bdellovibrionales bacterium]
QSGSVEAFETLLSRHEAKVYNLAMRFTRDPEDAEEVMQDVFSTVYRKIAGFEGKSAFSSWVYRITVNAAFMKLRKRKQKPTVFMEDLSAGIQQQYLENNHSHENRADSLSRERELRTVLQDAVHKLPEQYRAVFILRDVDGMSNEEVSKVLNITLAAVKSRLHRARLMLRKKLQAYYDDFTGEKQLRPIRSTEPQLQVANF